MTEACRHTFTFGRRFTNVTAVLLLFAVVLLADILVQPAAAHPYRHGNSNGVAKASEVEDDFYVILGLEAKRDDATERDIRSAWRKLSKTHHPDVSSADADKQLYQRIQRAYEVLGDRKKRKVYDIFGMEGVTQLEQPHQAAQPMNPLMQFFGFGGGGGGVQRGEDTHMMLLVRLEDLYSGAAHTVEFTKTKICRTCRGTGAKRKEDVITCPHCQGRGRVVSRVQVAPGFVQQVERVCPHCEGKGKHIAATCPVCRGAQVIRNAAAEVSVDVEAGFAEGGTLTFEMESDQTPGVLPGDLILTVVSAPHPVFRREGDDLHTTVVLTLKEALLGFRKTLKHLDDHEVVLTRDGSTSVQYGQQERIRGDGMPRHHVPSEKGDLIVTYEVIMPEYIRPELRDEIRQKLD